MLKKFVLGGMVVVAALLGNACGDDGSSDSPAGPADSEVTLSSSSEDAVSSSEKNEAISSSHLSSSSNKKAVGNSSSSDGKASASSGKVESSSSGKGEKSSSSEGATGSSSSDVVAESSSSEKSSSSMAESSSSVESSSSKEQSSSSVVESSSSVAESSSSLEIESSSSITLSSSSETPTVKSIYDAENNTLTDLRDNQVYKTVTIGEQIWMAENLNYDYKAGSKSFCYNDSTKYCNLYGRLYTYDVKSVKICPEGWHLPDSLEWNDLIGGNLNESLKADSSWRIWQGNSMNGTNETGFSVYASGSKNWVKQYSALGQNALFMIKDKSRVVKISMYNSEVPLFSIDDDYIAVSIRCKKDSE